MDNKTQHAFDVKKELKYRIIKDSDLKTAAQHALIEAGEWDDAVTVLQNSNGKFECQICVMAMFSIELYLKMLLMMEGENVTENKIRHNISSLFNKLRNTEKQSIKESVSTSLISITGLFDDHIQLDSFEEILDFIANDFIQLRYKYEKFMHGEPIYILQDFILELRNAIRKNAKSIVVSEL